jgi:hypothetical protein
LFKLPAFRFVHIALISPFLAERRRRRMVAVSI